LSSTAATENDVNNEEQKQQRDEEEEGRQQLLSSKPPKWMKCINGVVPYNVHVLNEAVSLLANVTRGEANELIDIGAVWAKMDTFTVNDALSQYSNDNNDYTAENGMGLLPASASFKYADLPKGWGSGNENDELKLPPRNNSNNDNKSSNKSSKYEEEDDDDDIDNSSSSIESLIEEEDGGGGETFDEYIDRQLSLRYRRILTPSTITPGTDIRIYPYPRRFPSCYDFSDARRLLYEDTTFIIVDKPPMLPTQPEPSNYEECCPGCVNLLLGPYTTITGLPVSRPLLCHRVDSCVGGCVVLSKDTTGQRVFSDLQRQRKIKKLYLAVTTTPVPIGRHVHWMYGALNSRGSRGGTPCQLVSHTPPATRKKAKVRVNKKIRFQLESEFSSMGYLLFVNHLSFLDVY
jgi:23S rRNA-/tRNA-specific pseudouridylate synthase